MAGYKEKVVGGVGEWPADAVGRLFGRSVDFTRFHSISRFYGKFADGEPTKIMKIEKSSGSNEDSRESVSAQKEKHVPPRFVG